jgi:hypothetical protein
MSCVDILMSPALQVWVSVCVDFFLVVECDMPWKDGLESKYGDSFRPWTEDEFQEAIRTVTATLPHNHLTTVVSFRFSYSPF